MVVFFVAQIVCPESAIRGHLRKGGRYPRDENPQVHFTLRIRSGAAKSAKFFDDFKLSVSRSSS